MKSEAGSKNHMMFYCEIRSRKMSENRDNRRIEKSVNRIKTHAVALDAELGKATVLLNGTKIQQ